MSCQALHRERKEDLESFVAVAQSCGVRLRQACSMASFTKSKATSFTLSLGIAMTRQQDKETSSQGSQPLNVTYNYGWAVLIKIVPRYFLKKYCGITTYLLLE